MEIFSFYWIVTMLVTIVSAIFFAVSSASIAKKMGGEPGAVSVLILVILPILAQAALIQWLFHPVTYAIICGLIIIMELVTVRASLWRYHEVGPATRLASWLYFSVWPWMGLFMSGALSDVETVKINGRNIWLYLIVPILTIGIGIIRVLLCGPAPEKTDNKPSKEGSSIDDDGYSNETVDVE